jgi:hypothetical protein
MSRGALVVAAAALSLTACGSSSAAINSSPTPTIQGPLDPAVALPATFPSDFPQYPGARPTAQLALNTNGVSSWEITWQTLDTMDAVEAFYSDQLKQGDWTVTYEGNAGDSYSAMFTRKSNAGYAGLLTVDTTSKHGVTTITLVLTTKA